LILQRLRDESFTLRRIARRAGWRPPVVRSVAPERPVGAKLELTHACNLRCGFCYTDSPRHTLARTPELSDEDWHRIAGQAIDLGIIETVLTGGEPLLRKKLLLELIERFEAAGVGISLNTNGWFVDGDFAARLGRNGDFHAQVSIDGATPEIHDASRGLPGSWRRAIGAVHLLLEHGVRVHVAHVVTPENERTFPDFLNQMWVLGVPSVRVTPVVQTGAAARGGDWSVDRGSVRRTVSEFRRTRGADMRISVRSGTGAAIATREDNAPRALLVRPGGAVRIDSLHPFAFGHALDDGLEECWRRITTGWRQPEISEWARSISSSRSLPDAEVVPYLDEDPYLPANADSQPPARRSLHRRRRSRSSRERAARQPLPKRVRRSDSNQGPEGDLEQARRSVRELALSRPYRLGAVRFSGGSERHVRRLEGGDVVRLNGTGGLVMDALADGTAADAVERLAARHPDVDRSRLERDALGLVRSLVARRVVIPAPTAADAGGSAAVVSPRA
jgi:MoaA/NifB/PqqE/SkfB family radical SAM enzyme